MLQAKNEKQIAEIEAILSDYCVDVYENSIRIDDVITYEKLAEVIDYLQNDATNKDLFEQCWVAYKRKGVKKRALEYWEKLSGKEKQKVLPHIKAYVSTRELQYIKDFERYLRDKVFNEVVYNKNTIVYDPSKSVQSNSYNPVCEGALLWDEQTKNYMYIGYWDGVFIPDGYSDDNRPNGATVVLNNGRGTIIWNSNTKKWLKNGLKYEY